MNLGARSRLAARDPTTDLLMEGMVKRHPNTILIPKEALKNHTSTWEPGVLRKMLGEKFTTEKSHCYKQAFTSGIERKMGGSPTFLK